MSGSVGSGLEPTVLSDLIYPLFTGTFAQVLGSAAVTGWRRASCADVGSAAACRRCRECRSRLRRIRSTRSGRHAYFATPPPASVRQNLEQLLPATLTTVIENLRVE